MDGMHRVAKVRLLGQPSIDAARFPRDPEPDHIEARPASKNPRSRSRSGPRAFSRRPMAPNAR